jgi:hypothetical protein
MSELWITSPESANDGDLVALRRWMTESGDLRGVPVTAHRTAPAPESMPGGGVIDALVTVVTDKTTLTAVTTAVAGWLTARRSLRRTRLRMRHGAREVEVDTAAIRDLDDLAAWLRRQLDEDDPPAGS